MKKEIIIGRCKDADLIFGKWIARKRSRRPIRIDPRGDPVTVFRIILMGFLRRAICEAHY